MPLVATRGAASAQGFGEFAQSAVPNYIEDVFSTWLYTGNGSTQTITNGIDLAGKGGLVWLKNRNSTQLHWLFDTARGKDSPLSSTNTDSVATNVANYFGGSNLCVFNSNGFTANGGQAQLGTNGNTYASWTFRKQPKFFDVVTWTADGTTNRQIPHNLGSQPGFITCKRTNSTGNWRVYHRSQPGKYANLEDTGAFQTDSVGMWTDVQPTYFISDYLNAFTGATYVTYLFAHNAGGFGLTGTDNVISCGSYTGTGAAGNAITLGYEPQWVLIKRTDSTGNWGMTDTMREMSVTNNAVLYSNLSNAELDAGSPIVYPTATGFTCGTGSAGWNASGGTYIYIAIRRGPMKTPTSGTSVFAPVAANNATGTFNSTGFPIDTQIVTARSLADGKSVMDRLRGVSTTSAENGPIIQTDNNFAELPNSIARGWNNTGFQTSSSGYPNISAIYWNFRRAPGFFDVVCYTGDGTDPRSITHNLTATPELMIVKRRDAAANWRVYSAATGATNQLFLNLTDASAASAGAWSNTSPTSSAFTVGFLNNGSGATFVAYLFATVAGVSKVGSYTGTGALQTINCGFTGGARFVLIKRTDSTGDWFVYDSARGISSGNDPYLLLNSTAAEVTGTNYVDTTSVGFQVTAAAPAGLNANGGSYIFLAVA